MAEDVQTIPDLVFKKTAGYNKPDCLMVKKGGVYTNISGSEVIANAEAVASSLLEWGVQKGDRIGLLSENRPEWTFADLGIQCAAAITVPIYGTLPSAQIEYIVKDSEMQILFVSNETQLKKILEIGSNTPLVKKIVVFDPPSSLPENVLSFQSMLEQGKEALKKNPNGVRERSAQLQPDDVFSIIYTSGTTGEPKGVMLTHNNVISNVIAVCRLFTFLPTDRTLSFLPLSHIFERMAGYYTMLYAGTTIAYAENIESVPKNLGEVKPTILISVPRVYEKFYQRVMDNVAAEHGIKKSLATWALKVAAEYTEKKLSGKPVPTLKYKIADKLVLSKVRGRLGGRLRIMLSGGAALPRQLGLFFYGLGLTILEGYGLSETSPVICVNLPHKFKFGTVGPPIPGVEVKIAEDGEILTRGPHVMKGYYKKQKATDETITPDQWFRTGDIGEIDQDGFLRITDRKKDLIVTSGGKNIAPQFVENALKTSRYVTQIVVLGDKRKFACALVVPNLDNVKKFAAAKAIPDSEILKSKAVLSEIQRDLEEHSKDLAPFERVKKIALLEKEFTIESGELTPSLKIKRNVVEKRYKEVIDGLYNEVVAE
ncbi:long-chain fatty acid--CoA ligase [bacterium]|nr:long-chain fatty acid--CoA ligase [bacterium]MCI0619045.1 long-chain fatty acid--CoA ligase [bacterium]